MKIKLVSDLHLEFSDINIQNDQDYDVLILGGDICIAQDLHDHPEPANTADQAAIANGTGLGRRQQKAQRFRDFLKRCSFQFPHVIYIMGNHEFYNREPGSKKTPASVLAWFQRLDDQWSNFHFFYRSKL